jgi:hypothetical protein
MTQKRPFANPQRATDYPASASAQMPLQNLQWRINLAWSLIFKIQ